MQVLSFGDGFHVFLYHRRVPMTRIQKFASSHTPGKSIAWNRRTPALIRFSPPFGFPVLRRYLITKDCNGKASSPGMLRGKTISATYGDRPRIVHQFSHPTGA